MSENTGSQFEAADDVIEEAANAFMSKIMDMMGKGEVNLDAHIIETAVVELCERLYYLATDDSEIVIEDPLARKLFAVLTEDLDARGVG